MDNFSLTEVDKIEVRVIITDELDPISPCPNPAVQHASHFLGIPVSDISDQGPDRGGAISEMRMTNICCGAHGLSFMITAFHGDSKKTLLFDAGPESDLWRRNCNIIGQEIGNVEHVVLSHYHRDHSGGLLEAIDTIRKYRTNKEGQVVVDLHPDRPEFRGIATPNGPISLEADPSFADIQSHGAELQVTDKPHTVLGGMFLVSGEIPRTTSYETGLPGALRFTSSTESPSEGSWTRDELIMDERYVMCRLKDKGLVIFTGCGHAGVINTGLDAKKLCAGAPIYCIAGGYHLSDASNERLNSTVQDMISFHPRVLLAAHCSGWKFKFEMEKALPGVVVPCTVGMTYSI